MLSEGFDRPVDFDLQSYLEQDGQQTSSVEVHLSFETNAYARARTSLPARIEKETQLGDRVEVIFHFENQNYLAAWLLRFGGAVRVLKPAELAAAHLEAAKKIVGNY